ncbi:GNAT family N-acetyltransferase [Nocardioides albertanoniae]|uniref:GNAT family N-acetyltransferase n=1 Tax=Nocardioides albertanoniae TaxID=1175486 RepID=UPI0014774C07|nr:GNAT family N-acetyltransferase [Nocardioides albertanoniae]
MTSELAFVISQVPVEETYPLRAKVLRNGGPPEAARLVGDDLPGVATYAARDVEGAVVGCVGLFPEPCPDLPDHPGEGWRIRGMATDDGLRGQGVGAQVLKAALDHVAAHGGGLVWCNARTTAARFYARHGFQEIGERWDDPEIGPHVRMWREVESG